MNNGKPKILRGENDSFTALMKSPPPHNGQNADVSVVGFFCHDIAHS